MYCYRRLWVANQCSPSAGKCWQVLPSAAKCCQVLLSTQYDVHGTTEAARIILMQMYCIAIFALIVLPHVYVVSINV